MHVSNLGEYCGLCGISGFRGNSVALVAEGLLALQHRGQEAAGVLVCSDGRMKLHKRKGTVSEAMSDIPPDFSTGRIEAAMGHVRYGTYGG
ncbi:MAG: amidophosphoribosyltransferase, partial [Candidatus Aegiribacteria sp.]|nr:amidophosphoribosyltransferase [Candidatus Aegiribacteria sp.]